MAENLNPDAERVAGDTSQLPTSTSRLTYVELAQPVQSVASSDPAGSVSQCHRIRYPTMSIRKSTTRRFPRSSRRPTRTAGDLSEVADASPGITTEDLARDLEAVASKPGVPTEREFLVELLRRVERIEQHLGIAGAGPHDDYSDS
jgi:hypothetical protein